MDETVENLVLKGHDPQRCRELVADYIRELAYQLRTGHIDGLKVEWSADEPTMVNAVVTPHFPAQHIRLAVTVNL